MARRPPAVRTREKQIELDEAALLLLVVDHIERVDERLHSGIGAPERQCQTERECKTKLGFALCCDTVHLLLDDLDATSRHQAADKREVFIDGRRFREQTIEGHESGDRRKQREQSVEHHARRDRKETILTDLAIRPPEDVLPSRPGDLPRRARPSTAIILTGALVLDAPRLVGTASGSECTGRRAAAIRQAIRRIGFASAR